MQTTSAGPHAWVTGFQQVSTARTNSVLLLASGTTTPTTPRTPTTLVSTNEGFGGFALDGAMVYWAGDGTVSKAVSGAAPKVLSAANGGASGLAIDATSVYWYDGKAKNVLRATPR